MESRNLAIGIVLSLQSALGILGNFSLLFYYLLLYYSEGTLKTIDLILTHVFTANSLIIFSKGMLQITGAFEWNHFFNDIGCKIILYILRLGRGMSTSTTCLLSVFQAITISPRNSCWKNIIVKAPRFMGFFISLCWILHMMVNMIFPMYPSTKRNDNNITQKRNFDLCSSFPGRDTIVESLYTAFWILPEVLLSVLLVISSSSMIIVLYGHKKRVQHIHSSHASLRISPESRATQNILFLLCTFLAFYTLSSILQGCITFSHNPSWWLINITAIISMCFPTLGPFVMSRDITISRFCLSWIRNIQIL
ncbi:vomeronasal type-1 receptor 4-like [Meriones unguiculatus]|uniref:vomeronasal type-1 receptor 4-like n=1 Tax=Meriones unguiculatus TaxID=10047 RepID=UPI00293F746B|nr:vomeronasal type-1 receptor 4-like [Meriones unguiculatus]